ncbi:hypothetical protein KSP39_PZI024361 [Platanthera zijinensis]|uniref:KANL3/Tex30 alpha/beta hydrolase-like domain-containing protein n=1 Tax=Platanthera zijinensis TaxID=2320716 RepID=A0AAP0AU00_9ASPA
MASHPSTLPSKRHRKNPSTRESAEKGGDGLHTSEKSPVVVFAHGAGAPSTSEWMIRWKKMLGEALGAVEVVTFDYPYISGGKRRAPPKAEKLVEHHLEIVKVAVQKYPDHPLVLVGKSMGSRHSCFMKAYDTNISALICLGYPLKVFLISQINLLLFLVGPIVFAQSDLDRLLVKDELRVVGSTMKKSVGLMAVEGRGHDFSRGEESPRLKGASYEEIERYTIGGIAFIISGGLSRDRAGRGCGGMELLVVMDEAVEDNGWRGEKGKRKA